MKRLVLLFVPLATLGVLALGHLRGALDPTPVLVVNAAILPFVVFAVTPDRLVEELLVGSATMVGVQWAYFFVVCLAQAAGAPVHVLQGEACLRALVYLGLLTIGYPGYCLIAVGICAACKVVAQHAFGRTCRTFDPSLRSSSSVS
jgi:hypothetical protein